MAKKYAMLRKIHTTSRLGLSASSGSEYKRLGSRCKSRTGSRPLRFFWITPSLVPTLPNPPEGGGLDQEEEEEEGRKDGIKMRRKCVRLGGEAKTNRWEAHLQGREMEKLKVRETAII